MDFHPGELIDGRFRIEREAGSGGMGTVYRAFDGLDGAPVAIKTLHGGADPDRFQREAAALAESAHPGIVAYRSHGTARGGVPFLAMEWLEGEDLAHRLARERPSIEASVALCQNVAGTLGFLHARGLVHRDVKPSNLFLEGGDIGRVKLLDFGIVLGAMRSTRTGTAVGTPGYMAPEQARGERSVDARADVFSLGCVLYECLTGRAAFAGDHMMAILAKILLEDAPRPGELANIPGELDDLVGRMLAKDPAARPAHGSAVAHELEALSATAHGWRAGPTLPPAVTMNEQRFVSIIMLGGPASANAPTLALWGHAATEADDRTARVDPLVAVVREFGAVLEQLVDGSVIVMVPPSGLATDQAARAASCALRLRDAALAPRDAGDASMVWTGELRMAIATGRADTGRRLPVGDAIDRAAQLVRESASSGLAIRIDQVTNALLDERFVRDADTSGALLVGRSDADAARNLLGRPAPCVGRDAELATLDGLLGQCAADGAARVAIVTGQAGLGKSRLRREFMQRIDAREPSAEVWLARAEPVGRGSAFGMAAQMIRRACGVLDGESLEVRRQKLRARVARHVPPGEQARVTDFLGEMIGASPLDAESVPILAARRDPVLMGDQIRRAWDDFLLAECKAGPRVLVLEDLHWGDLPTVTLVDAALRKCSELPLMVLALGRPELGSVFPELWSEHGALRVSLPGLPRRAAERLVRAVLPDATDDLVKRLVEQSGGNAFFLEELIRFAAEGGGDELPHSVLAMVEARLQTLDPAARRVMRAASVFGTTFWTAGVEALLGRSSAGESVEPILNQLVSKELVTRQGESTLAAQTEIVFRHALVREAAYGMLTAADKASGHRLAGAWLETAGEPDAIVLAEHFELGADTARAAGAYERAARQALEGNDLDNAVARANRGIACAPDGEDSGALHQIAAEAHLWRAELPDAARCAERAVALLPSGHPRWARAISDLSVAVGSRGDTARLREIAIDLAAEVKRKDAHAECLRAGARVARIALLALGLSAGEELLGAVENSPARNAGDPVLCGRIEQARAQKALQTGDASGYVDMGLLAASAFDEAGDARMACFVRLNAGFGLAECGAFDEARRTLERAIGDAVMMGLHKLATAGRHNLGWLLTHEGRLSEGLALQVEAAEAFRRQADRRLEGTARSYLAMMLVEAGKLDDAEREARTATTLLEDTPPVRPNAFAALARVLLARGEHTEALAAARRAMAGLESAVGVEEGEARVRLAFAEALEATGDYPGARAALRTARDRLLERAACIADEGRRRSFLEAVPENRATLTLAARPEA